MSDSDTPGTAPHAGSNLEAGFLLRMRSWRDLFPWLAVGDCLRPATSIVAWLLFAIALGLVVSADRYLPAVDANLPGGRLLPAGQMYGWLDAASQKGLRLTVGPWVSVLNGPHAWGQLWRLLLRHFVFALIWAVPVGFILRQSGLSMAGRLSMSTREGLAFAAKRLPAYLSVFLIPLLVMLVCWGFYWIVGAAENIPWVGPYLVIGLRVLGLPLAIVAGLIGFASLVALPLSWATISLERDGSSFDGLSRGYEYVLRRPLQTFLYIVGAYLIVRILTWLATGVAAVALRLVHTDGSLASAPMRPETLASPLLHTRGVTLPAASETGVNVVIENVTIEATGLDLAAQLLSCVPQLAALLVGWSLVSWLYLLLRQSTNHQEVEDVWEPPTPPAEPLPKLDPA